MGGSAVRTVGYPSSGRGGADRFPAGPGWLGLGEGVQAQESGLQPAFEAPGNVAAGPASLGKLPEIEMRRAGMLAKVRQGAFCLHWGKGLSARHFRTLSVHAPYALAIVRTPFRCRSNSNLGHYGSGMGDTPAAGQGGADIRRERQM